MIALIPPMSLTTPTPVGADERLLTARRPGVEFAEGELREKPAGLFDGLMLARVANLLRDAAAPAGLLLDRVGCRCFADDAKKVRWPDLSYFRDEHSAMRFDPLGLSQTPPSLAVEFVTPWTLALNLEARLAEYLAAGFGTVWVVYPNVRAVRVHRADGPIREFRGDDEITGEPFLPTFRCPVRAFFE